MTNPSGYAQILTLLQSADSVDKIVQDARSGVVVLPEDLRGDAGAEVSMTLDLGWTHLNTAVRMSCTVTLRCGSSLDHQIKAKKHCSSLAKAFLAEEATYLCEILPSVKGEL